MDLLVSWGGPLPLSTGLKCFACLLASEMKYVPLSLRIKAKISQGIRSWVWFTTSYFHSGVPGPPKMLNEKLQLENCSVPLHWRDEKKCPITEYLVHYRLVYSSFRVSPWFVIKTTHKNIQSPLQCNQYYDFSIQASNNVGNSSFEAGQMRRIRSGSSGKFWYLFFFHF